MPVNSFDNYPMSWRPVLQRSNGSLCTCLAEQLARDIGQGVLPPGTKLPPQRELADFLDINVSTVSRAFKLCAQRGLLTSCVGSGTFVAYDIPTNIMTSPASGQDKWIELGSMMPETIPQPEMAQLLKEMMDEPDFGRFFQYSQGIAPWHLKAAEQLLARAGYLVGGGKPSDDKCFGDKSFDGKCFDDKCFERRILFAGGGQNSLAAIFAGLFRPGDRLGVDPLVYPGVKSAARLHGIQIVPIAQENGQMSEEGIRYAVKNHGVRALYVMPDCQNPTTLTMSVATRRMIAHLAGELDLLIIEDGIHSLLMEETERSIAVDAPEHTIFALSLSKTVSPALRLAYLAVPPRYVRELADALYNINLSQSALLLELASRLIVSGKLEWLLRRRREGLQVRNRLAKQVLCDYQVQGSNTGLNRWLLLPPGVTGMQFEALARRRGVAVYGCERFAVGKQAPVGAVRLAICSPENLRELEQGLTILRDLLRELSSGEDVPMR